MVGTLGIGVPPQVISTGMTTPDPVCLQYCGLPSTWQQGLAACAIEASSIGIDEHRLDGARSTPRCSPISPQDHLDYHGSMEAYWQAKAKLFAWAGPAGGRAERGRCPWAVAGAALRGRAALDAVDRGRATARPLEATDIAHTA